ncbi:MAG: nucleotidyltransferase family protein [Kiloniellaceae bacterium]
MSSQGEDDARRRILPRLAGHPEALAALTLDQWDLVVRQAMRAGILARLCFQLDELGVLDQVPERPRRHLESARTLAHKHMRDVRWEVTCVCRVLAESQVPITLLKGAAYVMADLPPARGRLFSDIDFMVPRERIGEVEQILAEADWGPEVKDDYDQRYYRLWTHQIPPLRHFKRNTVLDVHHTIVPLTARAPVEAATLAAESLPLGQDGQLRVLAPTDMVLHSAVHLFNEGEFDRGLRDLLDLSDLLRHFGAQPGFWDKLAERAEVLGLTGPLSLTLRYLDSLLDMALPDSIRQAATGWQPSAAKRAVFDALLLRALLPDHDSCDDALTGTARWLLYVRAHYLRMPLYLLLPHLLRKSFYRPREPKGGTDRQQLQAHIEQLLRLTPRAKSGTRHAKAPDHLN